MSAKQEWFTAPRRGAEGYYYRVGKNIGSRLGPAESILGEHRCEMDRILDLMADMNTEQTEVVATLFAAWNDLLIDGLAPSDEAIVSEVRENWHPSKRRFDPVRLQQSLGWMQANGLIPRGIGPRTMVSGSQQRPTRQRRSAHGTRE